MAVAWVTTQLLLPLAGSASYFRHLRIELWRHFLSRGGEVTAHLDWSAFSIWSDVPPFDCSAAEAGQ